LGTYSFELWEAGASIPKNYEFEIIDGHKFWDGGILSNTPLRELVSNHITWWSDRLDIKFGSDSEHDKFELSLHNWDKFKDATKIPDLDLYIVNLHPTKEGKEEDRDIHIAEVDYDMIKDRENDIRFHDKTEYDQEVATMVTDYITFIDKMGDLTMEAINKSGSSKKELKDRFDDLLNDKGLSTKLTGEKRTYLDLLKNRFT
jgi:NTE family protein